MPNTASAILLSFDVEEFDIPLEYGCNLSLNEQMEMGRKGLNVISEILDIQSIECTLFTTANFAQHFPSKILQLSNNHEIASHTFYHSSFKKEDLKNSREVLEAVISKKVYGLRMPRMRKIDPAWIQEARYGYDSSLNPTWIPGKYNNLSSPRSVHWEKGLTVVPFSVSANLRIPLFWLSFKNFPYWYYKKIALQSLKKDGHLCIYFHPWEFTNIDNYGLPIMVKRKFGDQLVERLNKLISDLKSEGNFITFNRFLEHKKQKS